MEEIEQKTYIHKVLDIVINQFKDLKEDQKQLNESVDKIVTWLIGFIFIFIGIIFSNSDKIPLVESKLLIIFLVVTIIIGLISRIFSYLFNLSYASNLSALEMDKAFFEKELDMKLLVDDVNLKQKWKLIADKNKLLQMNSKSWVRNGLKLFKNIFTYSSILTVVLFIISLVILLETFFN